MRSCVLVLYVASAACLFRHYTLPRPQTFHFTIIYMLHVRCMWHNYINMHVHCACTRVCPKQRRRRRSSRARAFKMVMRLRLLRRGVGMHRSGTRRAARTRLMSGICIYSATICMHVTSASVHGHIFPSALCKPSRRAYALLSMYAIAGCDTIPYK